MVSFKQTELKAVGAGEIIFAETPPFKKYKTVFVCPYEGSDKCPKSESTMYYESGSCYKSPIVQKDNGKSVCKIVVDVNEPRIEQSLNSLGDYLKFRNGN